MGGAGGGRAPLSSGGPTAGEEEKSKRSDLKVHKQPRLDSSLARVIGAGGQKGDMFQASAPQHIHVGVSEYPRLGRLFLWVN